MAHGLPDRLEAFAAAAAGTSPRMLLYHFATKDGLLVLAVIRGLVMDLEATGDATRTGRPGPTLSLSLVAAQPPPGSQATTDRHH